MKSFVVITLRMFQYTKDRSTIIIFDIWLLFNGFFVGLFIDLIVDIAQYEFLTKTLSTKMCIIEYDSVLSDIH